MREITGVLLKTAEVAAVAYFFAGPAFDTERTAAWLEKNQVPYTNLEPARMDQYKEVTAAAAPAFRMMDAPRLHFPFHDEPLDSFAARVCEVARQVIPDLAASGRSFYAIALPLNGMAGLEHGSLCATFAPRLKEAGLWNGPGPCVLVDFEPHYEHYVSLAAQAGKTDAEARDFGARHLAGLILHELSHAIEKGHFGGAEPLGGNAADAEATILEFANEPPDPMRPDCSPGAAGCPWAGHGPRFIRAACNIAHRLQKAFPELLMSDVHDNSLRQLSHIGNYWHFLPRSELESEAPIHELLATAAPADFLDFWKRDMALWCERQVFKTKEHLRIRNEGLSLASPQRMKAPGQELA